MATDPLASSHADPPHPPSASGASRAAAPISRPPPATARAGTPLADPDERELLRSVRAGCEQSAELFVRRHAGRMRAVALHVLGSEADVDDVVQEALLSAFRSLDRFEERSSLATWLHRVTVNAALLRIRARRGQELACLEELLPEFTSKGAWPESVAAWPGEEEDPLVRKELQEHVRECIARLPEKHRIPLLMRDIEGLGNGDIARRLDISVNAAKIRVHRARQAVRCLLEPLMVERTP